MRNASSAEKSEIRISDKGKEKYILYEDLLGG